MLNNNSSTNQNNHDNCDIVIPLQRDTGIALVFHASSGKYFFACDYMIDVTTHEEASLERVKHAMINQLFDLTHIINHDNWLNFEWKEDPWEFDKRRVSARLNPFRDPDDHFSFLTPGGRASLELQIKELENRIATLAHIELAPPESPLPDTDYYRAFDEDDEVEIAH